MSRYDRNGRGRLSSAAAGFSLVELMITIVVLAIGVGLAIPTFKELIRNSNVSTTTNDLMVSINLARMEAIKRGTRVAVMSKSTTADWSSGWDVVVDAARDGTYTGDTVRTHESVSTGYAIYAKATGAGGKDDRIVFDSSGAMTNGLKPPDMTDGTKTVSTVDINVCSQIKDKKKARWIRVIASGQTSSRRDATSSTVTTACPG